MIKKPTNEELEGFWTAAYHDAPVAHRGLKSDYANRTLYDVGWRDGYAQALADQKPLPTPNLQRPWWRFLYGKERR